MTGGGDTTEPALRGHWHVRRISGLLPPAGIGKVIGPRTGATTVFGVNALRFTIEGRTLRYHRLPICDRLTPAGDGTWSGEGRLFGWTFCHFLLTQ